MSESDGSRPVQDSDEDEHPLKTGIDAAEDGDTASLEDVLSKLD